MGYHFCGGVDDLDLFEDGCAVVGDEDLAFAVLDHFVHASWTETGSDNIG